MGGGQDSLDFRTWRKAELHCHLDGALRQSTVEELLGRPVELTAPASCTSLAEYIAYFDPQIEALQTEAALERCAFELGEDSAAEGIDYLEVRWAPQLHVRRGLSIDEVIGAVVRGLEAASLDAVAIVCALRQESLQESVALAQAAGRWAGRGVAGFDLAGDEARWPNDGALKPAFAAARAAGLRLTCHAGEAAGADSVAAALGYGVERIAHGVTAARSPELVARLRDEGIVLDLCPTANWKCKAVARLEDHPLPELLAAGVRCTISTDSRTVAGTTLSEEFRLAHETLGLSLDDLTRVNLTAYEAAFSR